MSISTPVEDVTVRRAPGSAPLITAADLPPTSHFVDAPSTMLLPATCSM